MSDQRFAIRTFNFGYNDEIVFVAGAELGAVYACRDEAETAVRELELRCLRTTDLSEHESFFDASEAFLEKVDAFVRDRTGEPFFKTREPWLRDGSLPPGMSDDDLIEFGEIARVNFCELVVFDGEPVVYVAWDPREDEPMTQGDFERDWTIFGESREDVLSQIGESIELSDIEVYGPLESLSESPELLAKLIASSEDLEYEVDDEQLYASGEPGDAHIDALNALLTKPLYEVRTMTLEAFRAL